MNVKNYVRALLCLYLTCLLSIPPLAAQALKVGDSLPPELWNMPLQVVNHPEGRETITLSEYNDKLIIVDFWSTRCGSCIKGLDKLDSLQKELGDQLAVVPVTYESKDKALAIYKKRGWGLLSTVSDTVLKSYFPHVGVPHLVWVREGRVMAVTGSDYTFRENIQNALENKKVKIVMKEVDVDYNPRDIIEPSENSVVESGIIRKARYSGARTGRSSHGFFSYNASIRRLFEEAYQNQFLFLMAGNRTIIEAADPWKINYPPKPSTIEEANRYASWKEENMYTYYIRFSRPQTRETIFKKVQADLLSYFGEVENLTVVFEKRNILCLILKRNEDHPNDYKQVNTYRIGQYLNGNSPLPVIDETGNPRSNIPVDFKTIPTDYPELKSYLASYGIDLVKENRMLEMMIIKDKPSEKL